MAINKTVLKLRNDNRFLESRVEELSRELLWSKKNLSEALQISAQKDEQIKNQAAALNEAVEKRNEMTRMYTDACRDFGFRTLGSGELRKPKKEVSINISAIAETQRVEDIHSMTIREARVLGVALQAITTTAQ